MTFVWELTLCMNLEKVVSQWPASVRAGHWLKTPPKFIQSGRRLNFSTFLYLKEKYIIFIDYWKLWFLPQKKVVSNIQLRLSLLGGMFQTVLQHGTLTTATLLMQLIITGIADQVIYLYIWNYTCWPCGTLTSDTRLGPVLIGQKTTQKSIDQWIHAII